MHFLFISPICNFKANKKKVYTEVQKFHIKITRIYMKVFFLMYVKKNVSPCFLYLKETTNHNKVIVLLS